MARRGRSRLIRSRREHLEALFGGIESAGAQWGFTDCELVAGSGPSAAQLAAARVSLDATHTTLAKADSVGHAFIDQTFAAVGSGAIGFSRALHAAIGGFRPFAFHELWDFALRATLQDEPVHVAAATYRHAIGSREQPQTQADREATQLAMFRDFYARTCTDASPARIRLRHRSPGGDSRSRGASSSAATC